MNLIEVQISEIKNLNLIYIFTTDYLLRGKTDKYIGAKIVFDGNRTLSLDYKDPLFESFIKKIIERYNQEKDQRNIILLGKLTQDLMSSSAFDSLGDISKRNTTGFTLFNTKNHELKKYESYLKAVLKDILKINFGYESVVINKIDGYNNKFVVYYSVGTVDLECRIILSFRSDTHLDFKMMHVDDRNLNISGTIENNITNISSSWESINNMSGTILFDVLSGEVAHSIKDREIPIYHNDSSDTLLENDEELIQFYLDLFGIPTNQKVLKTGDYSYILGDEEIVIEEGTELFIKQSGTQIEVSEDEVLIRYKIENILNKYQNRLNISLDKTIHDITLSKLNIDKKIYVLIEHRITNSTGSVYEYKVFEVNEIDFKNIFKPINEIEIDSKINSIAEVRKLIKVHNEGGIK